MPPGDGDCGTLAASGDRLLFFAAALERRSLLVTRVLLVVLLLAAVVSLTLASLARRAQVNAEDHAIALQTQESIARDKASALGTQQAISVKQANQLATQVVVARDEAQARGHAEAQEVSEQQEVMQQARLATSRELALAAIINLEIDPERSVLLAIQALSIAHTREAQGALHRAVLASRVRLSLPGTTAEIKLLGATAQGRAIFTYNVRDFKVLGQHHPQHAGIILAYQRSMILQEMINALDHLLRETDAKEWIGQTRWLSDWKR